MKDHDFLQATFNTSFPLADFNHKAHLRFTYLCLQGSCGYSELDVSKGIFKLVEANGAAEHFNQELTDEAIALMKQRMSNSEDDDFEVFIVKNEDLLTDFKSALATFKTLSA